MRRRLSWLFAFACLAVLAGPPANAQGAVDSDICAAGDDSAVSPEQRIAACTRVIAAAKEDTKALVDALVKRAGVNFYLNHMNEAFADLNRAIGFDPKNAAALRLRGESYRVTGRIDRALADANDAIRLDPKSARGFDNRGNAFVSNKQYDRAIEDYNVAIGLDPDYALSYMDRGAAYYFKGEYQNAINDYDQSIKLDSKRAQTYSNRGAAYKKLGRHEQAVADNNTAISLDKTNPLFYDNRGLDYEADGDYDRAIADFSEAIRLKPQANFLTNRGDCYNQKHDYDRAVVDYNRALALDPSFQLALNNRGVTYAQMRDYDRAIADFEQALRVNPHLDSAASGLADAREQRARRQLAGAKVKPTFDCNTATQAVEKAICSDPELTQLDRDIDDAYRAALGRLKPDAARRLRSAQHDFVVRRNRQFGSPDYQFKQVLESRLTELRSAGRN
jgi:tetratricopeptide (TPR) repeat protein